MRYKAHVARCVYGSTAGPVVDIPDDATCINVTCQDVTTKIGPGMVMSDAMFTITYLTPEPHEEDAKP